jgi:hypothetical protein
MCCTPQSACLYRNLNMAKSGIQITKELVSGVRYNTSLQFLTSILVGWHEPAGCPECGFMSRSVRDAVFDEIERGDPIPLKELERERGVSLELCRKLGDDGKMNFTPLRSKGQEVSVFGQLWPGKQAIVMLTAVTATTAMNKALLSKLKSDIRERNVDHGVAMCILVFGADDEAETRLFLEEPACHVMKPDDQIPIHLQIREALKTLAITVAQVTLQKLGSLGATQEASPYARDPLEAAQIERMSKEDKSQHIAFRCKKLEADRCLSAGFLNAARKSIDEIAQLHALADPAPSGSRSLGSMGSGKLPLLPANFPINQLWGASLIQTLAAILYVSADGLLKRSTLDTMRKLYFDGEKRAENSCSALVTTLSEGTTRTIDAIHGMASAARLAFRTIIGPEGQQTRYFDAVDQELTEALHALKTRLTNFLPASHGAQFPLIVKDVEAISQMLYRKLCALLDTAARGYANECPPLSSAEMGRAGGAKSANLELLVECQLMRLRLSASLRCAEDVIDLIRRFPFPEKDAKRNDGDREIMRVFLDRGKLSAIFERVCVEAGCTRRALCVGFLTTWEQSVITPNYQRLIDRIVAASAEDPLSSVRLKVPNPRRKLVVELVADAEQAARDDPSKQLPPPSLRATILKQVYNRSFSIPQTQNNTAACEPKHLAATLLRSFVFFPAISDRKAQKNLLDFLATPLVAAPQDAPSHIHTPPFATKAASLPLSLEHRPNFIILAKGVFESGGPPPKYYWDGEIVEKHVWATDTVCSIEVELRNFLEVDVVLQDASIVLRDARTGAETAAEAFTSNVGLRSKETGRIILRIRPTTAGAYYASEFIARWNKGIHLFKLPTPLQLQVFDRLPLCKLNLVEVAHVPSDEQIVIFERKREVQLKIRNVGTVDVENVHVSVHYAGCQTNSCNGCAYQRGSSETLRVVCEPPKSEGMITLRAASGIQSSDTVKLICIPPEVPPSVPSSALVPTALEVRVQYGEKGPSELPEVNRQAIEEVRMVVRSRTARLTFMVSPARGVSLAGVMMKAGKYLEVQLRNNHHRRSSIIGPADPQRQIAERSVAELAPGSIGSVEFLVTRDITIRGVTIPWHLSGLPHASGEIAVPFDKIVSDLQASGALVDRVSLKLTCAATETREGWAWEWNRSNPDGAAKQLPVGESIPATLSVTLTGCRGRSIHLALFILQPEVTISGRVGTTIDADDDVVHAELPLELVGEQPGPAHLEIRLVDPADNRESGSQTPKVTLVVV